MPQVCGVFDETRDRDNHQANTVLGARIFPAYDPRRYALFLMSGLLGGPSMDSRRTGMFPQARRQLCGQLLVSGDNRESCAMSLAKSLMRHGEIHDNRHTAERIMELSADDVRDVAEIIASQTFSRLTLI